MFYPKNISEKFSFDLVVQHALQLCETEKGKSHFYKLKTSNNSELINLWLNQTAEIQSVLQKGELSLSLNLDFDIQEKKTHITGFYYEVETISEFKDLLISLKKVQEFSQGNSEAYPLLFQLFSSIAIDYKLIDEIDKIIGPDNEVRSNASKGLQKIITQITTAERSIIRSSNALFSKAKESGYLAETELGIKNGRVVLPVLSEHKRKISGVLIDQSGTGKISYIEPLELVGLNNELAELHIKKRQEIILILKELSAKIITYINDIKQGIKKLAAFDFMRAKARLALDWKCILPKIGQSTSVIRAIHPMLQLRLAKEGKSLVPLDYILDDEQRIIVISGPNAGGKSVALKTVGLLQYMLQSGFLVPCNQGSEFRVFENIFVDIGDNQSIESDLSTYSSHLKAAKHIINFCDANTLVLMDEIGTGTDPMFGGPMAEAVLEEINKKEAFGIITTHFSNIKAKAKKLNGVENAAMLFDIENLVPLYKLQVGQPGSSFVYEVASNIGLNKRLIKRAKQLTNTKQYDLDSLLAEVQSQKEELNAKLTLAREREAKAELFESEYLSLKQSIERQKAEIIAQAKEKANGIIKSANKEIENTIREIKENKADKAKTKVVRDKLASKLENKPIDLQQVEVQEFKIGDKVLVKNSETVGEVVEIKKNKVTLQIGSITTKTNLANLEKVGKKTEKAVKRYISNSSYSERQLSFSSEKDVRGMRTVDALSEIDSWIDSAIILGIGQLTLLHGKGSGILKQEVRRHLKPNKAVKSITYAHVELGGEGVSIIELN